MAVHIVYRAETVLNKHDKMNTIMNMTNVGADPYRTTGVKGENKVLYQDQQFFTGLCKEGGPQKFVHYLSEEQSC